MNNFITNKKIVKYVYKINQSINTPINKSNNKLYTYLKHLNHHGNYNYKMTGGDFVQDKIIELNNILEELSKKPPLDIDSVINDKINKTELEITNYNNNIKAKLVSILISMGKTEADAKSILGI